MIELYLVRHGKTEWNDEHRLQGAWGDSPLLKEDLHRVKALAERLEGIEFAEIYSSPLKRAFETAQLLAKAMNYEKPIRIAEALREFDFGVMEGKRDEDLPEKYQAEVSYFFKEPEKYNGEKLHGESYQQAALRTKNFIISLLKTYSDQSKIILVSHGGILNILINALLQIPLKDYRKHGGITNASLTRVNVNDDHSAQLIDFNNTDHLNYLDSTDTI
ncbi:histidine phosphatase family protein [Xylocopilactobacillus apis]|uniref:Phosphoglycerate mutase n=1 Tax=Xylocopilactobacillus apis TaxID=2932183 RepID=A0AAU9DMN6_9LACO|nr:histidine phosphatase family protein [Xylocopilactobacillus apis]BDR56153.1 phosphoglycerate mutase [Xylocopilactobacillus apis]